MFSTLAHRAAPATGFAAVGLSLALIPSLAAQASPYPENIVAPVTTTPQLGNFGIPLNFSYPVQGLQEGSARQASSRPDGASPSATDDPTERRATFASPTSCNPNIPTTVSGATRGKQRPFPATLRERPAPERNSEALSPTEDAREPVNQQTPASDSACAR